MTRLKNLHNREIKNQLLIIISGPEPQRSLFEKKIIDQSKYFHDKAILVRGLPGTYETLNLQPNVSVFNHVSGDLLSEMICQSEFVIARSGYSTIMDLVSLKKKSILIPTPGQPEQEYLAQYLSDRKIIFTVKEEEFDLNACIESAKQFPFLFPGFSHDLLKQVLYETKNEIERRINVAV